jgi:outer membrane protein assembly factor BamA
MIRSYFHPGSDGHYDAAVLDAALERLYATGFFTDVEIAHEDHGVLVRVVENPVIRVLAFEGNSKIKDDDLKKQVFLVRSNASPTWELRTLSNSAADFGKLSPPMKWAEVIKFASIRPE